LCGAGYHARLTGIGGRRSLRAMQGILTALLIVAAVASRPIEARLWRAGRISDRTAVILLLGRLPVLVLLFGVIQGYELTFVAFTTATALIVPLLFFRLVLNLLREQRRTSI
jgi:hypothetical protein